MRKAAKFNLSLVPFARKRNILAKKYDDPIIADYVTRKTLDAHKQANVAEFDAHNYRYFVPFTFLSEELTLQILDFGGGAGHHFYSMMKHLPHRIGNWTVIETQSMVEAASKVAPDPRLKFESSISAVANRDFHLVLASSSIQYAQNPLRVLEELLTVNAEYYFITRMPLWDLPTTSILQKSSLSSNGPGRQLYELSDGLVEYELNVLNREEFEGFFKDKLELILRAIELKSVHIINGTPVDQHGYLFRRKKRLKGDWEDKIL